ncbi:MAG TPA: trypsin-like peptidase domain-containing protein [Candidatus Competibacter sp.]|nr:trypsin-like peptidase domain-containing protein [Candidatus Competibacter sp.]
MKPVLATLASMIALAFAASVDAAGQYETIDYYVQQMIAQANASDAIGVQTFREQMENLRRPEAGDSAKAQPFRQQGLEQLARNNLKEALTAFRQAFITDPADPEIAGQLGQTYLRLHRFKEAERLSVYALSLAPARSATWLVLGEVYGQTGDAHRAAGAFTNAYRFAKDPPQLAEQLRQLAATSNVEAVRAGAQQTLQSTRPDPNPKPAATPVLVPQPAPTTSVAPTVAPKPSPNAGDTALADAASAGKSTVAGAVFGSLKRGLENLTGQPNGATPASDSSRPQALNADSPGQRIYQQSIPLTCLIVTFRNGKTDNLGSGLLVSTDGLVITNNHVVEKADNLAVKCGERESAASVRKRSKEPDLALLATSLQVKNSFVLNETYNQDLIGRDVFVIGNPYGLEGTFSTGVISGLREIEGVRYIQISAPVSPGNSGGPVILRDGTVIGIAAMGLKAGQNLNFAIASTEVIASRLFDPTRMKSRPLSGK